MFDIGWGELLLIGIVALIAIGPKELPGALRALGQWMTKIRRMASEFQNQFHEAMREAELADLKKEVDEMATKAQSYANFDPIEDIRKDIESAAGPLDLNAPPTSTPDATVPASSVALPDAATPSPNTATPSAEAAPAVTPAAAEPAPAPVAEAAAAPPPAPTETVEAPPGAGKPDAGRAA